MTKYQGINKETGQKRGPYRTAVLRSYDPKAVNLIVQRYFCCQGWDLWQRSEPKNYDERYFHCGGATVHTYKSKDKKGEYIEMHLMSNDSLEDIVKNLSKIVPGLKAELWKNHSSRWIPPEVWIKLKSIK